MQKINFRAFTLVELIVVITIVGILSTVGFVSYSNYLTGARDSNRISQMVKLSDSLQVYSATRSLPLPDNHVEITASGTTIAYQGEVGVDVLETIDFTNGGTDPKDDSFYTYYLTKDRNSLQLMALMEEQTSVASLNSIKAINTLTSQTQAQFEDRFPKVYGRKLGVLTQVETNIPVQELSEFSSADFDVVNETDEFIAHISDDEKLEGTGSTLQASNPESSCRRIKQTGGSDGNGIYTISPLGEDFNVYCDMDTAGGGWTLVARSYSGSTATNFGWLHEFGSIDDDNEAYSMGPDSQKLSFDSIMIGSYDNGKNIDLAISLEVEDEVIKNGSVDLVSTSSCKNIVGELSDETCARFAYWGVASTSNHYRFYNTSTLTGNSGILADGIGPNKESLANEQGMILVK